MAEGKLSSLKKEHRQVLNEYLRCFNKTEAYMAVYNPKTRDAATSSAWRLFRNADFQEALQEALSESAMSAEEALMRLGEQARAEYSPYVTSHYRLNPDLFVEMPEEARHRYVRDGKLDYAEVLKDGNGHLIEQVIGVDVEGLINDGKSHLIKGVKHTPNGINVEFYDAQSALVHVGRHHKLFTDKSEITGKDGEPLISADALAAASVVAAQKTAAFAASAANAWSTDE